MQTRLLENLSISQSETSVADGLMRELGNWKVQTIGLNSNESPTRLETRVSRGNATIKRFEEYVELGRQTSKREGKLGEQRGEAAKVPHVSTELAALADIGKAASLADTEWQKLARQALADPNQIAGAKADLLATLEEQVTPLLHRYREISETEGARETQATAQYLHNSDIELFSSAAIAMIVTLTVSWLLARALVLPLRNLSEVARAISHGDRSLRVRKSDIEEYNAFGQALNRMLDALEETTVSRDELERTVKERIRELDDFFRLSADILCIADFRGKFIRVNPAVEQILGYTPAEILARPFLDFIRPADREKTTAEMHRLTERDLPTLDFENFYICKDGSERQLSWKCVPIKSERLIYCTARDVTRVRATEEALRQSEENLAITLNSIADGVLTTDANGAVLQMNPAAEQLTGWSNEEARFRPVEEILQTFNDATREPLLLPVKAALTEGQTIGITQVKALITRDGVERSISDSVSPIRDKAGKITGAVLTFRDVTQAKLAAEATERRRNRTLRFQHSLLRLRDFENTDLQAFYRLATEECARALEIERVSIWLFETPQGDLVCQDIYLQSEGSHSAGIILAADLYPKYFKAISQLEPLVAHDARTHPDTVEFLESYLKPSRIFSMLDLPIRAGGELTGVICCEHVDSLRHWKEEEVKFVGNIANALLVAIERQERGEAEEKLRASEEYNRSIVRSTEDCLLVLNLEGRISYMGEPGQKLLQIDDFASIRDANWLEFWSGSDREAARRSLEDARAGRIGRFQGMCPTVKGVSRWWDSMISPINDAHGAPCRLLVVSRDITHQRRNEDHVRKLNSTLEERIAQRTAELAEKEERFRLTIEQIQDYAIIMLDAEGIITSWNSGAKRTHGYETSEIIGQTTACFFTYGEREQGIADELLRRAKEHGHVVNEGWRLRKDGSRFWAEVVINAIHDETGQIVGFAQVTHDLSQRRQADLALRQSEEQFPSAMENSAIGMALVALDGRWLKVNPALCGILGYTPDELLISNFQEITYPEDLNSDLALVKKLINGEIQRLQMEKRYYHKDGHLVWALLNSTLMRDAIGEPKYFISQIQDISERKRSEEAMFLALEHEKELVREAKAAEHAKSEFLGVMSHEVRTPMNGILGFAEMLAQDVSLPETSRDQAQTIVDSGASLLRILDDILDFSRLEAGRLRIESDYFSPRKVVEDIGVLLTPSAHDKGLTLVFNIAPQVPQTCEGDAARIRQILLNLSGNAIKFTQRGSITIGLRCGPEIHLGGSPALEFFVRDTGLGISEDRIFKVFEPFEQADSSTSRRFGGTGLGLTISRRLAVLMGGTLTVQSQLGQGAEFLCRLPLRTVEKPNTIEGNGNTPVAIDTTFALAHPLRVLVAEDDRVNLKLILTMMRKFGYQPVSARDGHEAVEAFQREPLDCILMDLQMPGMDGIEATRRIREIEKAARNGTTFISALTANTVPNDQKRCFDAGMNDYLNKPIKHEQLAALLTKASAYKAKAEA